MQIYIFCVDVQKLYIRLFRRQNNKGALLLDKTAEHLYFS